MEKLPLNLENVDVPKKLLNEKKEISKMIRNVLLLKDEYMESDLKILYNYRNTVNILALKEKQKDESIN